MVGALDSGTRRASAPYNLSPVSIQTQSLALPSNQSWLPLLRPSIPIGWRLRLLRFSFTQRTQRKRLRLNGNRALLIYRDMPIICTRLRDPVNCAVYSLVYFRVSQFIQAISSIMRLSTMQLLLTLPTNHRLSIKSRKTQDLKFLNNANVSVVSKNWSGPTRE